MLSTAIANDLGNYSYYDKEGRKLSNDVLIRFSHKGSVNYVISRNHILTGEFTYRRDGFTKKYEYDSWDVVSPYTEETYFKLQSRTLGIGLKRMNYVSRGFIAPVGNFFEFRLFMLNTLVAAHGQPRNVSKEPLSQSESINELGVGISWGMQTVWFDRFIPSYTIGIGWRVLRYGMLLNFQGNSPDNPNFGILKDASEQSFGGLTPNMYLTGQVGIGVLLF